MDDEVGYCWDDCGRKVRSERWDGVTDDGVIVTEGVCGLPFCRALAWLRSRLPVRGG